MLAQQSFRADVLTNFGASASETEELLAYNQISIPNKDLYTTASSTPCILLPHSRRKDVFHSDENCYSCLKHPIKLPLVPEAHVTAWEEYAVAARVVGAFEALKQRLVQFQFPVQWGISQTAAYRAATRNGMSVDSMAEATGLVLQQPKKLQLIIHQSLAGSIPVLLTGNRKDFVSLVQALTMQNEPKSVPASMGACIVSGFNNWDRIRSLRQQWSDRNSGNCSESSWAAEFQRIRPQKELYQDRFIILSDGPYPSLITLTRVNSKTRSTEGFVLKCYK